MINLLLAGEHGARLTEPWVFHADQIKNDAQWVLWLPSFRLALTCDWGIKVVYQQERTRKFCLSVRNVRWFKNRKLLDTVQGRVFENIEPSVLYKVLNSHARRPKVVSKFGLPRSKKWGVMEYEFSSPSKYNANFQRLNILAIIVYLVNGKVNLCES